MEVALITRRVLRVSVGEVQALRVLPLDHVDAHVGLRPLVHRGHGRRVPHVVHLSADERLRVQRLREH